MVTPGRHPKKEVAEALERAKEAGLTVTAIHRGSQMGRAEMSVLWRLERRMDDPEKPVDTREADGSLYGQTRIVRAGDLDAALSDDEGEVEMTTHSFKIVLDRPPSGSELDRLFEAGCDDATFGVERGLAIAEFDRDDDSLAKAVASAIRAVESAGLLPLRVIDEDILSLADIADRIDQSRESVRRYATGERGPGGFPPPVNPGREGTVFYRWSEVAPWFHEELGLEVERVDPALTMANLVLQARRFRDRVRHASALSDLLTA